MLKGLAQFVGLTTLDLLKIVLKEYGLALLWSAFIGFIIGLVIVIIARRRLIPKRTGGRKWLNRLYYLLILFVSCSSFTVYRIISKIETAGQHYMSTIIDENRREIDSVEQIMILGKAELLDKVKATEQSLAKIEVLKRTVGFLEGKDAATALSGILQEHLNVMFLKEVTQIVHEWNESGKPLADVMKEWSHDKAHYLFKPYYTMVLIFIIVAMAFPAIEILVWKQKMKKAQILRAELLGEETGKRSGEVK